MLLKVFSFNLQTTSKYYIALVNQKSTKQVTPVVLILGRRLKIHICAGFFFKNSLKAV